MKKLMKQWRYEIVIVLFLLLLIFNIRGWATVSALQTNYQSCQSNIDEIKELYNSR